MTEQLGFDIDLSAAEVPAPAAPPARRRPARLEQDVEIQAELIDLPPAARPKRAEKPPVELTPQMAQQKLASLIDKICGRGHSHHQVFDDFLELSNAALIADDETYLRVIKPYGRPELSLFAEAFAIVMSEAQKGYHDVIGPAYEELGSRHRRAGFGQFFTPWNIAVMMAEMQLGDVQPKPDGSPLTILDPTVGAGVLLLAAADVIERHCPELLREGKVEFYGQDIDATCVAMSKLNLRVHGLMDRSRVLAAVLSAPERARREVEQRAS